MSFLSCYLHLVAVVEDFWERCLLQPCPHHLAKRNAAWPPHLVLCPTLCPLPHRWHFNLFENRSGMNVTVEFVSLVNFCLCQENKSCPPSTNLACDIVSNLYAVPHQRGTEGAEGCCRGNAFVLDVWHECASPLATGTIRSISMWGKWRHRGFSSPCAFLLPWNETRPQ